MNGQAALVSAFHYQHHPTHDGFGDRALLAAPASAGFSGGLPLPFRTPAALPALYNHHAAHVHAHLQQQQQHQQILSTSAAFARPLPPRMATFAQDEAELARLQELSNKWESDATVSTVHCHVCRANTHESRAHWSVTVFRAAKSPPSTQTQTLSSRQRPRYVFLSYLYPSCRFGVSFPHAPNNALTIQQSLPQKYAQYRTCRGDGHCGWRGMFPMWAHTSVY
jgi:hypothetical protein